MHQTFILMRKVIVYCQGKRVLN